MLQSRSTFFSRCRMEERSKETTGENIGECTQVMPQSRSTFFPRQLKNNRSRANIGQNIKDTLVMPKSRSTAL